MGVKFYTAAEIMMAKEIGSTDSVVFHVGEFNGGTSAIHADTFDVDENCLDVGVRVFRQYVIGQLR